MRPRPECPSPRAGAQPLGPAPDRNRPHPPFTPEQAQAEAARCLSLSVCQGCEACQLICPDQAISKDPATGRPVIDLAYCKGCGLCAHVCPKGAIVMEMEI